MAGHEIENLLTDSFDETSVAIQALPKETGLLSSVGPH